MPCFQIDFNDMPLSKGGGEHIRRLHLDLPEIFSDINFLQGAIAQHDAACDASLLPASGPLSLLGAWPAFGTSPNLIVPLLAFDAKLSP